MTRIRPIRRSFVVTIRRSAHGFGRLVAAIALVAGSAAVAQDAVLDRPVRAGELTLFPSARDASQYYYVADRARLVRGGSGAPQFSFLQYVDSGAADGDESEGGGIVHFVVELGVPEDVVADAERALASVADDAELLGAIPFRSGKFALISSIASAEGEDAFAETVLGVGNAPLLEGERAAISVRLTREGAELMAASLENATTDLSVSFEMQVEGYRAPKQAKLVANFERIYSNDTFAAGIATPYLQADIEAAFDDLRREGHIELTDIGADADQNALIKTAYDKLIEIMFEAAPTTGTTALQELSAAGQAGSSGGGDLLSRANSLLTTQRTEARAQNDAIRQRNAANQQGSIAAAEAAANAAQASNARDEATSRARAARTLLAEKEAQLAAEREAREAAGDLEGEEAEVADQRVAALETALARYRSDAETAGAQAERLTGEAETAEGAATTARAAAIPPEEAENVPGIAIVASYRMKRSKVSGEVTINLNKYTAMTLPLRFDQNLGDLRRFADQITRIVDVGATAFQRREVEVFTDLDAEDFGTLVNSATVILRKEHEDATVSEASLSINRANFNDSANAFTLSYNRLGDSQASAFRNYEYEVLWNFAGGIEMAEPPRETRADDIVLAPRMARRTLSIEADPEVIEAEGIRAITVQIFVPLPDRERIEQVTLRPRPDGTGLSQIVDVVTPDDATAIDYELTWIMRDGTTRTSGRRTANGPLLFADTL